MKMHIMDVVEAIPLGGAAYLAHVFGGFLEQGVTPGNLMSYVYVIGWYAGFILLGEVGLNYLSNRRE